MQAEQDKKIDEAVRRVRQDGFRGVQAKENMIKRAMFEILKDEDEVERMFVVVKAQKEY